MARLLFIRWHINYVLLFSVIWNMKCVANKVTTFSKQTSCKLQAQLSLKCVQPQDRVFISVIECATDCAKLDNCIGVSSDRNSGCYHHIKCSQDITCENVDDIFTIYIKEYNSLDDLEDDNITSSTTSLSTFQNNNDTVTSSTMTLSTFRNNDGTVTTSTITPLACLNNGIWNTTEGFCKCSDGWVGKLCERLATNCNELSQYGYPQGWPDGLIWVTIKVDNHSAPFKVLCELRVSYFNTYILRNNGWPRLDPAPTKQDYINGFYKSDEYFWLGLEKMKVLNDAGHTTVKLDTGFATSDFNLFQMTYKDFILENTSAGFKFNFQSTERKQTGPEYDKMNYGDCLTSLQGAQFYTPDDQPNSAGKKCAQEAGTGWWFKPNDCPLLCNPLGYKTELKAGGPRTERIIMEGTDCENISSCIVSMYFVT